MFMLAHMDARARTEPNASVTGRRRHGGRVDGDVNSERGLLTAATSSKK